LAKGENVLVVAHGNSLRSIVMSIEKLTGEQIVATEIATGVPIVYKLSPTGEVLEKNILERTSFFFPLMGCTDEKEMVQIKYRVERERKDGIQRAVIHT
jgi:broad specificity phosphatase PhoE